MSPLHAFLKVATALANRPAYFWSAKDQETLTKGVIVAVTKLQEILQTKKLERTIAYKTLAILGKTLPVGALDELGFIHSLGLLVDVYRHESVKIEMEELLDTLHETLVRARKRILEHHLSLEALKQSGKKMKVEEKLKSDQETMQKVGIFYVLEYTLQVLFEFTRCSEADKRKLFNDGLKTDAGNLPAYWPLEDTFRKELCYKIFDEMLRDRLLLAFYNFEEMCSNDDMRIVGKAIKIFNLEVLRAFSEKGLSTFRAVFYKPFGSDLPIEQMITMVEAVKL